MNDLDSLARTAPADGIQEANAGLVCNCPICGVIEYPIATRRISWVFVAGIAVMILMGSFTVRFIISDNPSRGSFDFFMGLYFGIGLVLAGISLLIAICTKRVRCPKCWHVAYFTLLSRSKSNGMAHHHERVHNRCPHCGRDYADTARRTVDIYRLFVFLPALLWGIMMTATLTRLFFTSPPDYSLIIEKSIICAIIVPLVLFTGIYQTVVAVSSFGFSCPHCDYRIFVSIDPISDVDDSCG